MTRVAVTEKLPVLEASAFPNDDIVPFTIAEVRHVQFRGDRGLQDRIILVGAQHDGKVIWPNMTSLRTLVEKFGDDDVNWVGKTVPLVKVLSDNPRTGGRVTSLWVAGRNDEEAWSSVEPRSRLPRAKKSAGKRGR